jgi:DIM1 family U5 snRNP protein
MRTGTTATARRDATTDARARTRRRRAQVPDFIVMYELYDPCTVMFFFRNKHIQIDLGTGNNNKVNWAMDDKQEFIDIVETVYTGARKGRGLVISPRDYSTKYRY